MNSFWAQERADAVVARHRAPYVISDEKTPSGKIHVGALRGVLLHDAVARTLKKRGHQVKYIYGFDDFDPFDKIPVYLDQQLYEPYLGKPISDIPAPDQTGKPAAGEINSEHNYGRFYADEFGRIYRDLGVDSETRRTSELYREGKFNQAIEIVLNEREKVAQAYQTVIAHRSADRAQKEVAPLFPLNVICAKCGKVSTTQITNWDGKKVSYQCLKDLIAWTSGCGYQGQTEPFDGKAKMPWKVEWAAKWFIWQTDLEGAGKDHCTKGGSREVAIEIFRRVFAPHLESSYQNGPEGLPYEWFQLEGAKMSTSRGFGITATQIANQIPANILRFAILKTKPKSAVNFNADPENLLNLYNDYDRYLEVFWQNPEGNEGQVIEISRLDLKQESPKFVMKFSKLIYIIQMFHLDPIALAVKEKGSELTEAERQDLESRILAAQKWLESAPEQYQLKIQERLADLALDNHQKEFLQAVLDLYQTQDSWQGDQLQKALFDLKNKLKIDAQIAFTTIYLVFLNRTSGPQAGLMLASLKRDFVIKRLQEAITSQ